MRLLKNTGWLLAGNTGNVQQLSCLCSEVLKMRGFKVLFITNYPSPYRVDFFNLLGQQVDLTVAFMERPESQFHRSEKWFNSDYSGFEAVFLHEGISIGGKTVFKDVFQLLRADFDYIILGGYSSATQIAAIEYMRIHRISFSLEADGGLLPLKESRIKFYLKRHLISAADYWLSSGDVTKKYFVHYGAKTDKVFFYPFTSQRRKDIAFAKQQICKDKSALKKKLNIQESRLVITVGQMIYRKGIDVLLRAAKNLPEDVAVYIIGGEPTHEYVELMYQLNLKHVYFEGFKAKEELADYYCAADLFVMPTREDVWGLVINEAMSFGLPIVSTDRCVAAMELVEDGKNGKIVPVEEPAALAEGIINVLNTEVAMEECYSAQTIENYTIENMVEAHMAFFQQQSKLSR